MHKKSFICIYIIFLRVGQNIRGGWPSFQLFSRTTKELLTKFPPCVITDSTRNGFSLNKYKEMNHVTFKCIWHLLSLYMAKLPSVTIFSLLMFLSYETFLAMCML